MWLSRGICNYRLENLKLSETCLKRAEKEGCKDRAASIYLKVSSTAVVLRCEVFPQKVQERLYPDRMEGDEDGAAEDGEEVEKLF